MSKPYLNIQQQIDKLSNKKRLIISNPAYAEKKLTEIGYFPLIGRYGVPFTNPMTRKFHEGTTFEDVVALYDFDKSLRELTLGCLFQVEQMIGQLITDSFCSKFGENQSAYLSASSYTASPKKHANVSKLIKKLTWLADSDMNHEYIIRQRKAYGNVPLWVLRNALTFGSLSAMYSLLLPQQQSRISKAYPYVTENELARYLNALTFFRNICAHSECLYSHHMSQQYFPDKPLHAKLGIPLKGKQYIQGKNDYFGLVIALRYLLPSDAFLAYKRSLKKLINGFPRKNIHLPLSDLLGYMGMPENWDKLTIYRP